MPYHHIKPAVTILRIGNTSQIYPHHEKDWVYIDHPTSTIQPSWGNTPFITDTGRHLLNFDKLIHTVFDPENTKGADHCQWITKLNTAVEIQHIITIMRMGREWTWQAQLHVRRGHILERVGKPQESTYRERTVIATCESLSWIFPVAVDPSLSPDLPQEEC